MTYSSDYFYGNEADQYTFYRIPKVLFVEGHFKKLSSDAKILYGLMLDRMGLSIKNNWKDEENKVYIYFTLEDIQEYMNCGHTKGVKVIAELDSESGVGLIERVKQGQGRPTKIYVKKFISDNESLTYSQKEKSYQPSYPQQNTTYPQGSQDFPKTEVQTSANEKSRLPQSRSADFHNTDTNNNDFSNKDFKKNDFKDTDFNSKSKSCLNDTDYKNTCYSNNEYNNDENNDNDFDDDDETQEDCVPTPLKSFATDDFETLVQQIKEQINYEWLITLSFIDVDEVDSFIFIILDTLISNSKTIRVNGEDKPQAVVKSMLSKITSGSVLYAINKFKEQKHEIKHKKQYLLTCLYNAQMEGVYNGINYLNRLRG